MKIVLTNQEVATIIQEHLTANGFPVNDDSEIILTANGVEIDFNATKPIEEKPKPVKKPRKTVKTEVEETEPETVEEETAEPDSDVFMDNLDEETETVKETKEEDTNDFSIFG